MHAPSRLSRPLVACLAVAAICALPIYALDSVVTQNVGAELPTQDGTIQFSGDASPGALVTFEKDGAVIGTQVAGADSSFDYTFTGQALGPATYSFYGLDTAGRLTDRITVPVNIIPGFTTTLSGYLLPPTLRVARNPVKRPQAQNIFGSTRQGATVTTFFSGSKYGDSFASQGGADNNGNWNNSPGRTLHLGSYGVSALSQAPGGQQSPRTSTANFQVVLSPDLNNDNRVNLTDFSILMFYYGQSNLNRPADINDDGRANLTDLSIMLFYWTG